MPRITTPDQSFDVDEGTRLVTALADNGADVSHRCGGFARCTTCRVSFSDGEPAEMTRAEFEKLGDDRSEYRLSCQVTCDRDMAVEVLMKSGEMDWDGPGPEPEDEVTPSPETFPVEQLTGS